MTRFAALLVCCLFCPAVAMATNPDTGMGATTPKKVPATQKGQFVAPAPRVIINREEEEKQTGVIENGGEFESSEEVAG